MPSSGYTAITFVANEQPTTAKWNLIGSNFESLKTGVGFDDNIIEARHMAAASVGAAQLDLDYGSAAVDTSQTTTSGSWANLATTGPSVTITVPSTGAVLILMEAETQNSTDGVRCEFSLAVSGANTISEDDQRLRLQSRAVVVSAPIYAGGARLLTGLTPGSTTFLMRYRVQSGTGTYLNRKLHVIPFGT